MSDTYITGSPDPFLKSDDDQAAQPQAPAPDPFTQQGKLNQPFGELKPYTPSWSEWVGNKLQDAYSALGADPYTAGKFGRGTRDVLGMTPAGPLMAGADAQFYSGQGDFGKAAISSLGVIPGASLAKSALGEGVNAATRIPLNFAENPASQFLAAPTSDQLKTSGVQRLEQFVQSPQIWPSADASQLASNMKNRFTAQSQFDMPGSAPLAHKAVDVFADKTKTQPFITPDDINQLRFGLSLAGKKGEPAGQEGKTMLYDFLKNTGDTNVEKFVGDYGAGSRGAITDTILSKGAGATGDEGRAIAAQARAAVENKGKRLRGFTDDEVAAVDRAYHGTPLINTLDTSANLIGGKSMAGQLTRAALSGGPGAVAAFFGGHPAVAALALAPELAAGGLRLGAGAARRSAVEEAGNMVRQRSPLFLERQAADNANPLYYPGTPAQNFVMRNAITQALVNQNRGQ